MLAITNTLTTRVLLTSPIEIIVIWNFTIIYIHLYKITFHASQLGLQFDPILLCWEVNHNKEETKVIYIAVELSVDNFNQYTNDLPFLMQCSSVKNNVEVVLHVNYSWYNWPRLKYVSSQSSLSMNHEIWDQSWQYDPPWWISSPMLVC